MGSLRNSLELAWSVSLRRWLTVIAVVGLSAAAAPRASLQQLVVIAGCGCLLALVRWPALGICCLIFASILVPFGISTGTETEINPAVLGVAVLAGLWALEMVVRHDVRLPRSATVVPLLLFSGISILAFLIGLQPWLAFAQTAPLASQLGGLAIFLLSFVGFLLAADRLRDIRWLRRAVWLFLAVGGIYMLRRAVGDRLPLPDVARGADGSLFWLWTVALAFSQGLFNRRLGGLPRLALLGLAILAVGLGVQNRDWNSGWVPGLVAVAVIVWMGAPRVALPLTLLIGVVVFANSTSIIGNLYNDTKQYDVLTRTAAWSILWDIVKINPITGTGFANYYWYTPLFPILGYNVRFNSHNNYVDLIAETGVLGLACFIWFVISLFLVAWRLRQRVSCGSFGQAYVFGGLGGLAGTLVAAFLGDWVLPFVYNIGMAGFRASILSWIFLGGLVGLEQMMRARPASALPHGYQ